MKKTLIWEPHYYEYIENRNLFKSSQDMDDEEDEVVFEDDEQDIKSNIKAMLTNVPKLMQTPFGMFQVDDALNPYRQFKMWMAHTNFDINRIVANTIEAVPGVELLHIFSRYRFIVGIAENFDKAQVRYNIQKALCNDTKEEVNPIEAKILELRQELTGYHKWAIYVFPNGNYSFTALKEDNSNLEEYERELNLYKESVKLSQGKLITHEST